MFPLLEHEYYSDLGAMREYAEALSRGIRFSAHGEWWHYGVGEKITSLNTKTKEVRVSDMPEGGVWSVNLRYIR